MKFVNRERELNLLERLYKGKGVKTIVIRGLRRIGKTRLVLEFGKDKDLKYVFIPKGNTKIEFLEELSEELGIPMFSKIGDAFSYLAKDGSVVFLDEFQNLLYLDRSAYSEIQKIYDRLQRENCNVLLIFSGSSKRLMKSVFTDYSKELFGRVDMVIDLGELPINGVWEIFNDIGVTDVADRIRFWSMFGGMPRFYEFIEKMNVKKFKEFLELMDLAIPEMYSEGREILRAEFGGDFPTYLSIITLILKGKNRLSEIASYLGNNPSLASRYLNLLEKESNLVSRDTPVFGSKRGVYVVKSRFLNFWGRVILPADFLIESRQLERAVEHIGNRLNTYFGYGFEEFVRGVMSENGYQVGRQWGKIRGAPKGQNTYEIDIVGIPKEGAVVFGEAKWKENLDARIMAESLYERIKYVPYDGEYEIRLFGKSFKKKVRRFKGVKVRCVDLKGIERMVRKRKKK